VQAYTFIRQEMSKATVRSDLDKLVPMVDQEMLDSMLENLPEEADSEGDAEEQAGVCVHDLYGEVVRVRLCLSQGEIEPPEDFDHRIAEWVQIDTRYVAYEAPIPCEGEEPTTPELVASTWRFEAQVSKCSEIQDIDEDGDSSGKVEREENPDMQWKLIKVLPNA